MFLRLVVVGVLVVGSLATFPAQTSACSCGGPPSPADEFNWAGSVFRGIATSIDDGDLNREIRVKFAVLSVWKGEIAEELTVITGHGGGDCGYRFHEGVEYIVYADRETNGVGICGRTAPVALAGVDLKELGPGTDIDYGGNPPTPYDPADRTPLGEKTWIIPIVATLLASFVGLIWVVMNRLGPRLG